MSYPAGPWIPEPEAVPLSDVEVAASQAEMIGEKIVASLDRPYRLGDYEHHSSASIGVAMFSGCDDVAEEILKRADMAMYQAKRRGPANTVVYDSGMHDDILERLKLEQDLRRALSRNELYCVYQPIYSMPDLRLAGFEALIAGAIDRSGA